MEYLQVQVNEVKEVKAILELIKVVAIDVKAKKAAAEIIADVLPKLIVALETASQLGDELKDVNLLPTLALGLADIVESLKA